MSRNVESDAIEEQQEDTSLTALQVEADIMIVEKAIFFHTLCSVLFVMQIQYYEPHKIQIMKNLSSRFLPLFAAMLMVVFFAACEKEEITNTTQTQIPVATTTTVTTSPVASRIANRGVQAQSSSSTGGLEIDCISIDYPFDLVVDSVSYTMNSITDVEDLFINVVTQTTMSVDFVYPLNVTLDDGSAAVAADGNELASLVSACIPGTGWGNGSFPAFFFDDPTCISLNYPATLEDENGATVSVVDATEFSNLLAANPLYTFVFPLSVIDTSGNVVNVQDENELFDLLAQCACPGNGGGNGGGHGVNPSDLSYLLGDSCFTYAYPINVIDFNGNTVVIADENAFSALLLSGDFLDFSYPFDVTLLSDGSQVTVNDGNEFYNILFSCSGGTVTTGLPASFFLAISLDPGASFCYTLVYPVTIDNMDGTTTVINDETEATTYLGGQVDGLVQFPVDIVEVSTGATVTLTSEMEFFGLLDDCQ